MNVEPLRNYLKSLPSIEEKQDYAKKCKTTLPYLNKVLCVKPKVDGALCLLLDVHSKGKVPKQDLRPDIWPDLRKTRKKKLNS